MVSRSPSRSEGEYISSDSEGKANKPKNLLNHTVNRHSRNHSRNSRRSRSRSRSPYRASRGEKRRREEDHRPKHDSRTFKVRYEPERWREPSNSRRVKRSRTYSPSRSRSRSPYRKGMEVKSPQPEVARMSPSVSTQHAKSERVPLEETNTKSVEQNHDPAAGNTKLDRPPTSEPEGLDEVAIIEARRKRREAIKNQYRGQATPLLVQALGAGPDTPAASTPTSTRSVSPGPASPSAPGTPRSAQLSAPGSPVTNVAKESKGENDMLGSPRQGDSPSAADYDPTADMQDERNRHDKRLFKEDETSEVNADHQVLEQTAQPQEAEKAPKDEFDMFAEGEDDMFAPNPIIKPQPAQSVAKTLDASLLDNWDDPEGYYLTNLRERIDDRYEVTANLGRGMFASVVRARDIKSKDGRFVAIKIIRNNDTMRKAGLKEVDILKDLAANDADDRKHVIRLLRSFDHKGHLCMVFENMDMNLREVLKKFGRDIGLNIKAIRAYAQQLFLGLSLLRKCNYIHADLKPDNILADDSRTKIKIADLGSASPITENATAPYLVSRFYRAPEVILGIEYDYGIDMWSAGCTLFELYTGKILFTGRNNNNMLKTIMDCRGKFPHKLLRKGSLTNDYFDDLLNFKAHEQDKVTGRIVTKIVDIKAKPVRGLKSRLMPKDKRMNEQEKKDVEQFADLLDKCLDLRPEKRITPADALRHPFITRAKS